MLDRIISFLPLGHTPLVTRDQDIIIPNAIAAAPKRTMFRANRFWIASFINSVRYLPGWAAQYPADAVNIAKSTPTFIVPTVSAAAPKTASVIEPTSPCAGRVAHLFDYFPVG